MINKKLIHFNTYSAFEDSRSLLYDWSIAFIAETKQIYTHGNFYDCDIEDINELNDKIDEILSDIYVDGEVDAPNGVYAVKVDGSLVSVDEADETCIGVALIVNDADTPQHIMIEKNGDSNITSIKAAYEADGATSTDYFLFYWGPYDTDVSGITNWTDGDLAYVRADYTTWSTNPTYAWNDYNGKANTAALMNVTDSDSYTVYANTATYCVKFNETETENQGFSDWYIPALGQLALIRINVTDINAALIKIGGTRINTSEYHWSSSEGSSKGGWCCPFGNTLIIHSSKYKQYRVRFIRDLESSKITSKISLKDKLAELEQSIPTKVSELENDLTELGTVSVGSTTTPIYLSSGTPTAGSTYAGGTAVTLNGSSKASSTASFYAPTSAGTSEYVLKSTGTGAPSWKDPAKTIQTLSGTSKVKLSPYSHVVITDFTSGEVDIDIADLLHEYSFEFECPDNFPGITVTPVVSWINYPDSFTSGKTYVVSIANKIGVICECDTPDIPVVPITMYIADNVSIPRGQTSTVSAYIIIPYTIKYSKVAYDNISWIVTFNGSTLGSKSYSGYLPNLKAGVGWFATYISITAPTNVTGSVPITFTPSTSNIASVSTNATLELATTTQYITIT